VVRLKKGATLYIPKALRFDRLVAGQIPTGWDAKRYGVPEDIANQVDPITLYVLVSTVESLIASGVTDPYEFYKYVHVSEVGNTSGGGTPVFFHPPFLKKKGISRVFVCFFVHAIFDVYFRCWRDTGDAGYVPREVP